MITRLRIAMKISVRLTVCGCFHIATRELCNQIKGENCMACLVKLLIETKESFYSRDGHLVGGGDGRLLHASGGGLLEAG